MSIRVKEENQELMLLVLEHSISGSSMKDLQNELDMIKVVMLVEAQFGVTFSVKNMDDRIIIVQKDASVISVADIVESTLADTIVEYNHFLLNGDIEKKKSILKTIADALEPKRRELLYSGEKGKIVPKLTKGYAKIDASVARGLDTSIGIEIELNKETNKVNFNKVAKKIMTLFYSLEYVKNPVYILVDELELFQCKSGHFMPIRSGNPHGITVGIWLIHIKSVSCCIYR